MSPCTTFLSRERTPWCTARPNWRRRCPVCWHSRRDRRPRGRDDMTVRVGINGFGRIGRNFLRAVLASGADVDVVGVNDLTSPETLAHLLRYDSTQGRMPVPVDVEGSDLLVGERHRRVMAQREPEQLPWDKLGVDVVIE